MSDLSSRIVIVTLVHSVVQIGGRGGTGLKPRVCRVAFCHSRLFGFQDPCQNDVCKSPLAPDRAGPGKQVLGVFADYFLQVHYTVQV